MLEKALQAQLDRAKAKITILEKMVEDKTRELFLEKEDLRHLSDYLESIIESIIHPVLVTDSKACVVSLNYAAKKLYNNLDLEAIGKSLFNVLPLKIGMVEFELAVKDGYQLETNLADIEKKFNIPVNISISTLSSADSNNKGFVCIIQDLTEIKALERQLMQSQKLESIGQLAAGIAHEINTPIQYVCDNTKFIKTELIEIFNLIRKYRDFIKNTQASENLTEILELEKEIDIDYLIQEFPEALDQTLHGAESVATIVRSMKEFSHPGVSDKVSVDINHALQNVLIVSKNEWKYCATVETKFADGLPHINCNPAELNQALLNLIVNSAHAIEDKIKSGELGKITIKTYLDEGEVKVSIADTGKGIPIEIMDRIFDPFFTTKDVGKGTGQGLSIVYKSIVENHGGNISFKSEINEGTEFIISLKV